MTQDKDKETIGKLCKAGISFEDYMPFKERNGEFTLEKGALACHGKNGKEGYLEIDNRSITKSFIVYYERTGLTIDTVTDTLKRLFALEVLPEAEYLRRDEEKTEAKRAKIRMPDFKVLQSIRQQYGTHIPEKVSPAEQIDASSALKNRSEYMVDPKKFRRLLEDLAIDVTAETPYRFIINGKSGYAVEGTPGYVLTDRANQPPVNKNCPEWVHFCKTAGLKPLQRGVHATSLMDRNNPMTPFSYRVNGGIYTDGLAINLITDHMVPMDDALDICHHKGGWYYTYKYMGDYSRQCDMDIIWLDGPDSFRMTGIYDSEEPQWTAKALVKTARLLYCFGAQPESIIMIEMHQNGAPQTIDLIFPLMPLAQSDPQNHNATITLGRQRVNYTSPHDNPVNRDPLIRHVRETYKRHIETPRGITSGTERTLLKAVDDLCQILHIKDKAITDAYEKAWMTKGFADVEIYIEKVHAAIRKTPLFCAIYGHSADPEKIFIDHEELRSTPPLHRSQHLNIKMRHSNHGNTGNNSSHKDIQRPTVKSQVAI